jgi:hypothetical protein
MEGESAFGYLNPALELDLSEYSRRLEKQCEDALHSDSEDVREAALRAKVIRSLIRFAKAFGVRTACPPVCGRPRVALVRRSEGFGRLKRL